MPSRTGLVNININLLRNGIVVASHQKKNCCGVAPGQACSGLRPKARCRTTRCALTTRDSCHIKRHPSHLAGATTEIRVYRTFCAGAGHGCACFPSLPSPHVTRHTMHLLRRDTRRPQVCPATRAKHPKWWPSSTISLQTFTSAFARVLSAACVVFFFRVMQRGCITTSFLI